MNKALYGHLTGDAGISALVSTRVFQHQAPTSAALDRITFTRVANEHENHLLGGAGLSRTLYQIDVWAVSGKRALAIAEAIRASLDGFIGKLMGTVNVRYAFLNNERDSIEKPVDGSEDSVFRISQDYNITHTESIPTP